MTTNKIFVEAKSAKTPEAHLLKTILDKFFPDAPATLVFMDGIGNLFRETIVNQIEQAQTDGEQALILVDADTTEKGYGFARRKAEIDKGMETHGVEAPYFLFPNNQDDGDVETLMESMARRDLHPTFFDCFEDYEKCVSGAKNENGERKYHTPNRKGKLHTYISAQRLSKAQRSRLGSGDWLFDDERFWDIGATSLERLKEFLDSNLARKA